MSCVFCCIAADGNGEIEKLVASFCFKEFHGDLQGDGVRDQLIKYTPKIYKKIAKETGEYPYVVYLEQSPIFLVDSYQIADIKQKDARHAYAIVNYHQLAKTEDMGIARKFIKDIQDISVKINLEYDGKRWWIIDPPYPQVSYDVILKYYEDQVAELATYERPKTLKPLTPQEQKKDKKQIQEAYNYHKSILDFLLSLKRK